MYYKVVANLQLMHERCRLNLCMQADRYLFIFGSINKSAQLLFVLNSEEGKYSILEQVAIRCRR